MQKIKIEKAEKKEVSKVPKVAHYIRVSALVDYEDQRECVDAKPRVAAYVRTKAPSDSTFLHDTDQATYFESLIKSNPDLEFAGIYADYGRCGMAVKNRPGFLRMIEDAKAGKIDAILTRNVSRFTRNTQDFLEYTKLLKGLGVEVFFENEMLSTMDSLYDTLADSLNDFPEEGGETAWKLLG